HVLGRVSVALADHAVADQQKPDAEACQKCIRTQTQPVHCLPSGSRRSLGAFSLSIPHPSTLPSATPARTEREIRQILTAGSAHPATFLGCRSYGLATYRHPFAQKRNLSINAA